MVPVVVGIVALAVGIAAGFLIRKTMAASGCANGTGRRRGRVAVSGTASSRVRSVPSPDMERTFDGFGADAFAWFERLALDNTRAYFGATREAYEASVHGPLEARGSADPPLDAVLLTHAVVGRLSDHLWQRTSPSRSEVDHLVALCLRAT